MSSIDYAWSAKAPPAPDVYTTRRNESRYLTPRYWDGHLWWQIEWHNTRGGEKFVWPKGSRTRYPSGLSRYRETMTLRRIGAHQGEIQWGEPFKVYDEREVIAHLIKTGRIPAGWKTAYQTEMRLAEKGGIASAPRPAAHTRGCLKVQHPHAGKRGWELADQTGLNQVCQDVTEADARRLAACWNALEGVSTDHLERYGLPDFAQKISNLRAQRDKLLEALKRIVDWDEAGLAMSGDHISQAKTAISKAEGVAA